MLPQARSAPTKHKNKGHFRHVNVFSFRMDIVVDTNYSFALLLAQDRLHFLGG